MMTAEQLRKAMRLLGWSSKQLISASGMNYSTIERLIKQQRGELLARARTLASLRRTLEAAGIEFTTGKEPGVRLRPATGDKALPVDWLNASNDE